MDPILLQQIRDKLNNVTSSQYGTMNRSLYLQEIRDAVLGAVNQVHGTMNELIYLQQIRNAILGVPDGQFGTMSRQLYLQEIRDAFSSLTVGNEQGSMDDDLYLEEILAVATGDDVRPTVTITGPSSPTAAYPIPITITFSEEVTGFEVGDITIVGSTLSNFATSDNVVFTVDATPTATTTTINIAAGVCEDLAGNQNLAATQFSITSGWFPTDISAADAALLKSLYDLTDGDNWTNKTNWGTSLTSEDWFGITVSAGRVSRIQLENNNLNGDLTTWTIPTAITRLQFGNDPIEWDLTGVVLPATTVVFYLYATQASGTVTDLGIPSGVAQYRLESNPSLTGSMSGWTMSAAMTTLWVYGTAISGFPIMTSAVSFRSLYYYDCALSQSDVDDIALKLYNRRASFTWATPEALIDGNNSTPSGIYQDGDPPTTGLEYIYELENDPEAEGFNVWSITYAAGALRYSSSID